MYRHETLARNPQPHPTPTHTPIPHCPLHEVWSDPDYLAWRAALPSNPTPEQVEELAEQGIYFMPEMADPNGVGPWFDTQVELEEVFPSETPLTDAWSAHQSPEDELPW